MSFSREEHIDFLRHMVDVAVGDDPKLQRQFNENDIEYLNRLARFFRSAHDLVVELLREVRSDE